jgi:hypothetical protein
MDKSAGHIQHFISFAVKHLKLTKMPNIRLVGHSEDSKRTFGHSISNEIVVRSIGRHPNDVMRTLAHELVHFKNGSKNASDEKREDMANAIAGRIMRLYNTKYPNTFKNKPITEEGEGGMVSAVPANAMGASSSASGPIQTYDPKLKIPGPKKLKNILRRNAPSI